MVQGPLTLQPLKSLLARSGIIVQDGYLDLGCRKHPIGSLVCVADSVAGWDTRHPSQWIVIRHSCPRAIAHQDNHTCSDVTLVSILEKWLHTNDPSSAMFLHTLSVTFLTSNFSPPSKIRAVPLHSHTQLWEKVLTAKKHNSVKYPCTSYMPM